MFYDTNFPKNFFQNHKRTCTFIWYHIVIDLCSNFQEIRLRRSSGDERLGLTLCYETDAEDGLTDIFIDDIHPDGVAAHDGRLRLGDQIIQINGIDVKTKAQAQEIFVSSTGDISFLVARPPCNHQYNLEDEDDLDAVADDDEGVVLALL